MPTVTHNWASDNSDTAVGAACYDGTYFRNTGSAEIVWGSSENIQRGFRQVDLAALSIPTNATVTGATFSRTVQFSAGTPPYKMIAANPISTNIAATDEGLFTALSGADYQDAASTTSGVVAVPLNTAGLADLQTRVTAGAATFMFGVVMTAETPDEGVVERGDAASSFAITYTEAASGPGVHLRAGMTMLGLG